MVRLFMFDHSGGVASDEFDVHQNGRRAVQAFVAFQMMSDLQLGFDPAINDDGQNRIHIVRDGVPEVVVLDKEFATTKAISSRGTSVWKGHLLGDVQRNPIVVKDTLQLAERPDEGVSLQRVTEGAKNFVAYYHHEVVHVDGRPDGTDLIRQGLAEGCGKLADLRVRPETSGFPLASSDAGRSLGSSEVLQPVKSLKRGMGASKRSSKYAAGLMSAGNVWVHRRIYMIGVGKPLATASTHGRLLRALADCVEGMYAILSLLNTLHSPSKCMVSRVG